MHYSELNQGQPKQDQFDPSTFIDFADGEEDELLNRFKINISSPRGKPPIGLKKDIFMENKISPDKFDRQLQNQVNKILKPELETVTFS